MAGKPIATLGSMHVCPMCTGLVPHVGGPVAGPGAPNVLINGKPAALVGDICVCSGPPDTIVQGEPTVLINGVPVATMGSMTAHGGSIVSGEPNVIIGSGTTSKPTTIMPVKRIPFPKIRIADRVGAAIKGKSGELRQAKENQQQLKEEAASEEAAQSPRLFNLKWTYEEASTRDAQLEEKLVMTTEVAGIDDGATIVFAVYQKAEKADEEDLLLGEAEGTVSDHKASAEWDFKPEELSAQEDHDTLSEEMDLGNYYFTVRHE